MSFRKQVGQIQLSGVDPICLHFRLINSEIGKEFPRDHPLNKRLTKRLYVNYTLNIKMGDIVRCDGYPYVTRPKKVMALDKSGYYLPFKLNSGYWVLRKSA